MRNIKFYSGRLHEENHRVVRHFAMERFVDRVLHLEHANALRNLDNEFTSIHHINSPRDFRGGDNTFSRILTSSHALLMHSIYIVICIHGLVVIHLVQYLSFRVVHIMCDCARRFYHIDQLLALPSV